MGGGVLRMDGGGRGCAEGMEVGGGVLRGWRWEGCAEGMEVGGGVLRRWRWEGVC